MNCTKSAKIQRYANITNFDNFTHWYREPREIGTDCTNFMWFTVWVGKLSRFCAICYKFWEFHFPWSELENRRWISRNLPRFWAFWLLRGDTWIFNLQAHAWMVWISCHSQRNNNTIVSEVSMIIKDTSACSLESNPEWVCAWLTSWLAFGCVPRGSDTASDGPLLHVIIPSRDGSPWLPINS